MDSNFDHIFKVANSLPKKDQRKSRKQHELDLDRKHPGSKIKPNRELSKTYSTKGGDAQVLKSLREAIERGELTREEAFLRLRGGNEEQPKSLKEIQVSKPVEPSLEDRLQDIKKRKEQQRIERYNSVIVDGFVYLVINPSYPGWIKVGQTSDYEGRLATYQTASPHADYKMIKIKWVEDRRPVEQHILDKARKIFPVKGEWIKANIEDLVQIF